MSAVGIASDLAASPGQNACLITSLSTELIYNIIDFIPPESHLDFACACKRIADCSSKILKRHQEAYSKYRVTSDISPTTIPTLLRSAFGRADPTLVWHVRSLEIWYDRTSWRDWKPLSFNHQVHDELIDVDGIAWKTPENELEEYIGDLEDQFDAMIENGDEDIRVEARKQFEDGYDGILKMLLIAYCPRLRDVKFVPQECHKTTTLGWLSRVIQGSILHGSHWPPGLCSIREVAVGVESETWMSQPPHGDDLGPWRMSMQVFSSLLRLPRLHSIYYNNLLCLDEEDDDHEVIDWDPDTIIPAQSSAVKHIFLDDCCDMPPHFRDALCEASVALETFTLRAGTFANRIEDANSLVRILCSGQFASLHTLMFYGPYTRRQIRGYRCSCYRNEDLQDTHNLNTVAINVADVELNIDDDKLTEDEQRKAFIRWFRNYAFPASLERLVFWGKAEEVFFHEHHKSNFLDWVEDALIDVIESRCWLEGWDSAVEGEFDKLSSSYETFYESLKSVHLEEIERQFRTSRSQSGGPFTKKVYFQRLIEVGKQAGIDIHTLTNRAKAVHEHKFPNAPHKYDLQTGPWWERRDEIKDWVFDVYKGRMVPPGCGKCGKCEQCLSLYSAELWGSLDA